MTNIKFILYVSLKYLLIHLINRTIRPPENPLVMDFNLNILNAHFANFDHHIAS